MRFRDLFFSLILVLVLLVVPAAHGTASAAGVEPVFSVSEYDPQRDAQEDLEDTILQASEENKRILLKIGGNWCGWCLLMDQFFHEHEAVATALHDNYIIMLVNFDEENENEEFLSNYPEIAGYPHIFVLDSDGTLLHSQDTEELEEGQGYNEEAVLDFLETWKPEE